eukprot:TRINITY_DN2483_c0_g1_i2.p1 TRINITY_DN2483_c0_g1~~TRINITY_DN2483_c0_g1_i2.p1  ORF type:complete len:833 (-),score=260.37 TRINITY_DN2483_c0_g1_i2:26-2524(-)
MSKKVNFNKLLEQSKQLTTQFQDQGFLIQRNIEQIDEASRNLVQKVSQEEKKSHPKAQILLARQGFDTEKLTQNLSSIDLKTTFEPLESISETDLESYLKHEHELIVLSAIEEAKKETIEQYNSNFISRMEDEWEEKKREIIEMLTQTGPAWEGLQKTKEKPKVNFQTSMDMKMLHYAKVVCDLNNFRLQKKPFGLATRLLDVAKNFDDKNMQRKLELIDCFDLLRKMIGEGGVLPDGTMTRSPSRNERDFEQDLKTNPSEVKRYFLKGARDFLEEQYNNIIQTMTKNNLQKAQLGGRPTTIAFVKGYLNILFNIPTQPFPDDYEKSPDGYPMWAVIYYCIRCGDLNAAIQYAASVPVLANFVTYMKSYTDNRDRKLPDQIAVQILQEYRQLRNDQDPYKSIVFNLLGRCDATKSYNAIRRWTTQDFMWFKLNMITSVEEVAPAVSVLSLPRLQSLLREYGPAHFNKDGQHPLLYFQILLLTQQFEVAIQYLESTGQFFVENLHFAHCLYYYGILRQPPTVASPLFGENNRLPYCNFIKLLTQYVKSFMVTDSLAALHYLFLIQDEAIRNHAIKDLVLTTGDFDTLLGRTQPDGSRAEGDLEKFVTREQWQHIVELAANDSENNGKYEEAIKLYDLSQHYDKVMLLMNKCLGRVLVSSDDLSNLGNTTALERSKLIELSNVLVEKYKRELSRPEMMNKIDEHNMVTFKQLKALLAFFDYYNNGRYYEASELIKSLNIIPFNTKELEDKVNNFKTLSESIRRNFAEILLATMTSLFKIYTNVKAEAAVDPSRVQFLERLKTEARALIMFSGMIQFRMPGDTHSKLLRMEVYMN